jgi:hypothetical protein
MGSVVPFVMASIALFLFIYFGVKRSSVNKNLIKENTEKVKNQNKNKKIFICNSAEDLGHENMLQLYGESFGTPLLPNLKLVDGRGMQFKIIEVFADDDTPEIPDIRVEAGIKDTPIVINNTNWDWNYFSEILKKEGIVVFRLED